MSTLDIIALLLVIDSAYRLRFVRLSWKTGAAVVKAAAAQLAMIP